MHDRSSPQEGRLRTEQTPRLLVRQTLIEERERRRLGRVLHDDATQSLVEVRRQLADDRDGRVALNPADSIAAIDRVIRVLHDLTADLSPPVLVDLGLLPAMHWLAESHGVRYGCRVMCEDDGEEPSLSLEARTIVFRALRELVINAAKHAPGARIVLSSAFNEDMCQFAVRDDGPGFDRSAFHPHAESRQGYGLLSVEQQIHAMGGRFEILSAAGMGTRATITLHVESGRTDARHTDDA